MAKFIGRLVDVGFGIESVRGTAVAVQNWQPKTDISFDEKIETIQDESSIGVIADSRGTEIVKTSAEGDVTANVEVNSIGYVLFALLGSVTSTANGVGAYDHDFALTNSNSHPSLTIGMKDPVNGGRSYPLAMVDEVTISANQGEFATVKVKFMAKPGASATHTVAYEVDNKLLSRNSEFKIAANLAGLNAAQVNCIESFEITFKANLEEFYCLGSKTPSDFVNKQFSVEGSFTAAFDSTTFKDLAIAGTKKAARFELVDSETIIGTAAHPALRIDMPLVSFTEFKTDYKNDDIVKQTLSFKGIYSVADSEIVSILLTNTKATYAAA